MARKERGREASLTMRMCIDISLVVLVANAADTISVKSTFWQGKQYYYEDSKLEVFAGFDALYESIRNDSLRKAYAAAKSEISAARVLSTIGKVVFIVGLTWNCLNLVNGEYGNYAPLVPMGVGCGIELFSIPIFSGGETMLLKSVRIFNSGLR